MLTTLELLQETERLLLDTNQEFEFHNWSHCTCGFIYGATNDGVKLNTEFSHTAFQVMIRDEAYKEAIIAVATALGWAGYDARSGTLTNEVEQASGYVSDYTSGVATKRRLPAVNRQAALMVVREAIEKVKAHEEAMRVKVINDAHFAPVAA